MKDCSHDSVSSILPLQTTTTSGSLPAPIDIGPQVRTRNAPLRNRLKRRPVLRVDKGPVTKPLGNGLLADRRTVHEFGNSIGKGRLATRDFNGAPQRDNVVWLHSRQDYTTKVVRVNNLGCVHAENEVGTLLDMSVTARKRLEKLKPEVKEATRDAEGRTLGERLKIGLKAKGRMLGREYTAKDLLEEASEAIGRAPTDPPIISQQALSKIMTNKSSFSEATPAFAQVLGFNPLWLAYGVGPRCIADTIQ